MSITATVYYNLAVSGLRRGEQVPTTVLYQTALTSVLEHHSVPYIARLERERDELELLTTLGLAEALRRCDVIIASALTDSTLLEVL